MSPQCFLFRPPRLSVSIVYVYPAFMGEPSAGYSRRFVERYVYYPPGYDHETIIVLNKSPLTESIRKQFSPLQNVRYLIHDDSGWDIGAFQLAGRQCASDVMVFFGTSVYFKRPGWLVRMMESVYRKGDALYGAMGNRGAQLPTLRIWPHVRTTGFWCSREFFNSYPKRITGHGKHERYDFEHGQGSLTNWASANGLKTWVVAFDGEYDFPNWDNVPNGYQKGDQSNLLCGDRLTEPPFYKCQ